MRSRRTLRMILHAEDSVSRAPHSLHRTVENVPVGHGQAGARKRTLIHRIGVILGSDPYFSGCKILDRMIAAAMTEFQFVSLCAAGKRDDLMTETDSENRVFASQFPHKRYRFRDIGRIAGTI